MAATKEDVVSFIDNMSVLEMSEFVKELEEKYGVTAAAPAMAMAMPAAGGEAAAEEKTEFDVILTAIGDKFSSIYFFHIFYLESVVGGSISTI